MSNHDFINKIHRYLSGNCNSGEKCEVEKWMYASEENRNEFELIKKIWSVEPEKEMNADLKRAWLDLELKMSEKKYSHSFNDDISVSRHSELRSNQKFNWMRVAAALLIGAFISLFALWYFDDGLISDRFTIWQAGIEMQEIHTERADQAQFTLSDGTVVRLNSASMIRFPEKFESSTREVYLEGEAWFDVHHNPAAEFIVNTPDATIRVLGTEFNVKAYSDGSDVEIVVANGLVAVKSSDLLKDETISEVLLQKGEMTRIVHGQNPTSARSVNIDHYLSWLSNSFVFVEAPLSKVFAEWERRFDVYFEIENESLMSIPFTGEFRNETFDEMLRLTSLAIEFSYTRENNVITISAEN